jgi:hypothetical protein
MKRYIVLLCIFFIPILSYAQEGKKEQRFNYDYRVNLLELDKSPPNTMKGLGIIFQTDASLFYKKGDNVFNLLEDQLQGFATTKADVTRDNGTLTLWPWHNDTVADDGVISLPNATSGLLLVTISDPLASFTTEGGLWMVDAAGAVTRISGSTNTDDADTDNTLCVYDGGTYGIIKNRMGGVGKLRAIYVY